jgi:hypothetical protein
MQMNMNNYQKYQEQKTREALLYILSKAGDTGYFRLMKTIFCADRQNLLRWGDKITNLDYYARKHGPVPIKVHDELLSVFQGHPTELSDILTVKGNYVVHAMREPDMAYLSETDKESLDAAVRELKELNRDQIELYLHDNVYRRLIATKEKRYSQEDIAKSGGASAAQIAKIQSEQQLLMALS